MFILLQNVAIGLENHQPVAATNKHVIDFESVLWRAIQDQFPGFTIQGCVFHWAQAVYRKKAKKIGLQVYDV